MRLILNSNNSEWTRMKKFNDFMLHSRRAKSSRVSVYFVRLKRMFSEIVCLDDFSPISSGLFFINSEKDFNSFTFSSSSCFPLFQERSALEFGFVIFLCVVFRLYHRGSSLSS